MRTCVECSADISDRNMRAQRCKACAKARRSRLNREYDRARYNLLFAKGVRKCTECGGPASLDAKQPDKDPMCASCASALRKVWTRESVIAAIQEFNEIYGRPPGAMDWNVAMARNNGRLDIVEKWEDDACWPASNSVHGRGAPFARWNDAIAAAGFTPRKIGGRGPTSDYARRRASLVG